MSLFQSYVLRILHWMLLCALAAEVALALAALFGLVRLPYRPGWF